MSFQSDETPETLQSGASYHESWEPGGRVNCANAPEFAGPGS